MVRWGGRGGEDGKIPEQGGDERCDEIFDWGFEGIDSSKLAPRLDGVG